MGVETELSPPDQIQQAEIEVMRRIAAAREAVPLADLLDESQCGVEMLMPKVQILNNRRLEVQGGFDSLLLCTTTRDKLAHIMPALAQKPGNVSMVIFVNPTHIDALEMIGKRAKELTHGQAGFASTPFLMEPIQNVRLRNSV